MLKELFTRLFRRRFWQRVTLAEMAELYVSRTLRIFALHMITVFIAVYFATYFALKAILVVPAALLVGKIGPKHSTVWGNLLYIPALVLLAVLPEAGAWVLLPAVVFKACSTTLYDLAYLVNFSKVKHVEHVGKELGVMYILERVAHGVSPLVGGFIAFWFSPQVAIGVAAAIFALAALPLLLTAEPTQTHQKVSFKGLRWRDMWRSFMAQAALTVSNEFSIGSSWNLFLLIVVIATVGDEAYAILGTLSALTLLVSLVVPYVFGLLVDKKRGGVLLNVSVIAQSIIHLARPFIVTPLGAAAANVTSETAATGVKLPFIRGMFDAAEQSDNERITYMAIMEVALATGGVLANLVLVVFVASFGAEEGLRWMFVAGAVMTLAIMGHGFRLYRK
jgi:MFS family permease